MKIGDKVVVVDAKGLGKYDFRKGDICTVNSVAVIKGELFAMVMPEDNFKFFWVDASRLEVVEDDVAFD